MTLHWSKHDSTTTALQYSKLHAFHIHIVLVRVDLDLNTEVVLNVHQQKEL